MNRKVLVIDDDPEMGKIIEAILNPLEITIYHAYSGDDGLKQAYMVHPDLVILDVTMPGLDGFDVCSRLREFSSFPIMMLTARGNENDLVRSFNLGVDDFLRKPFRRDEFEVRVRALLRRSDNSNAGDSSHLTAYKDAVLEIDLLSQTVKLMGSIVELSPKEYNLLAYLVRGSGKVISHRQLVQEAWGEHYTNDPAELSLYMYYLRRKLKDGQHGHQYFRTVWGRGYRFAPRTSDEVS